MDFLLPEHDQALRTHPRTEAAAQQSRDAPAYTPDGSAQPRGDRV